MQSLLPYVINGISAGGQYALIAIGYTLVYGILRLINFAHGDVFMVAGLMMIYFTASLPMYLALPLVVVCTALLGFLIERAAYKPLRSAPRMSLMISAIGVSYLIQNLAFYLTGGLPQPVTNPIPWVSDMITVFGAQTKRVTLVTPVLTILLVLVLVWLTKKTKIGMAMRAASKDFETAQLMGIKINSVISFTFVIGRRRIALLHELPQRGHHLRRYAGSEGVRRGGLRRHRLDPGRGRRRVHHRSVRGAHQGHRLLHVLRRIHVRDPDRRSVRQADGSVR